MHQDTVLKWRGRFARDPTTRALRDEKRSGRPPRVRHETRLELLKLACTPPPTTAARTHWTYSALKAAKARYGSAAL